MRLSYSNLACPEWPFERTVEAVATYGFDGIEIRLFDGDVVTPLLSQSSPPARRVSSAFERCERRCPGHLAPARNDGPARLPLRPRRDGGDRRPVGSAFAASFGGSLPANPDIEAGRDQSRRRNCWRRPLRWPGTTVPDWRSRPTMISRARMLWRRCSTTSVGARALFTTRSIPTGWVRAPQRCLRLWAATFRWSR